MRRALTAAGVALAVCCSAVATADAATVYPKNANTFTDGAQGWVDVSRDCALLGLPLTLPPLLCSTQNRHAPGEGNPPGSLESRYQSIANLGGIFEGEAVWRSPGGEGQATREQFVITEATPGAITGGTLVFERKADVRALIDQGGSATTTVDLVNTTPEPDVRTQLLEEELTAENSQFASPRAVAVNRDVLVPNNAYVLEFKTTFTSTFQAAQGEVRAFYDNIRLTVDDGTANVAAVTTLLATDITDVSATLNSTVTPAGQPTSLRYDIRKLGTQDTFRQVGTGFNSDAQAAFRNSAPVTGLEKCTSYEYRAVAVQGGTEILGNLSTFTTNCAPDAVTLPASPLTATSVGLNSSINPNGPETRHRYALSVFNDFRPEATLITEERVTGSGRETKQPNTEPLNGLRPQTTYYYKVLASNSLGSAEGGVQQFTTPAQSGPGAPGAPGAPGRPGVVDQQRLLDQILRDGDERALLRIRQSVVSVGLRGKRAGQLRFRIFCRARTGRTCAGTVKIRTIGKINPSSRPGVTKRKRRVTFATFEYQLAQGKAGVAITNLTPEKLQLLQLRRGLGRSLGVTISVQVTDAIGNRQTIVRDGRLRLVRSPR